MRPAIKFCGLTRPDDACEAAALGATYLGVIFAPSPRRCTVEQAQALFDAVSRAVRSGRRVSATPRARARANRAGDAAVRLHAPPKRVGVFAAMAED